MHKLLSPFDRPVNIFTEVFLAYLLGKACFFHYLHGLLVYMGENKGDAPFLTVLYRSVMAFNAVLSRAGTLLIRRIRHFA